MKKLIKKLIPKFILSGYHKFLAVFAAFVYGHPSEKMTVIGVTGTNGKSTTVWLIAKALESSGLKVGATSTVLLKVADKEWLNTKKMTMLGRFQLQKLLKRMVDAGCQYAVVEVSSEGIKQYRHIGINFDYAVFTNLTPEHIESHGGFENYKKAKGELFKHLMNGKRKVWEHCHPELDSGSDNATSLKLLNRCRTLKHPELNSGQGDSDSLSVKKTAIINIDDEHSSYFLDFPADKKITFGIEKQNADFAARDISVSLEGTRFTLVMGQNTPHQNKFGTGQVVLPVHLKIIGAFNVYNALPAIAIGLNEGIAIENIKSGLEKVTNIPGRMEFIDEGQPFAVLVDYAPEPASMGKLYETIKQLKNGKTEKPKNEPDNQLTRQPAFADSRRPEPMALDEASVGRPVHKIIHVLGSCGGGRDKARRPVLGKIAGENADIVIVTNEDPYDDDPMLIINQVAAGAIDAGKEIDKNLFLIYDRRSAIEKAILLANSDDLVLITGKGAEQKMAVANGKYIPWDDREIAREILKKKTDSVQI